MKIEITKKQNDLIYSVLKFYRDEVTHPHRDIAGLNINSKEYKVITEILNLLKEVVK